MLKRLLMLVLTVCFLSVCSGILVGCEDEVKTHRESTVTTEQQETVVTP